MLNQLHKRRLCTPVTSQIKCRYFFPIICRGVSDVSLSIEDRDEMMQFQNPWNGTLWSWRQVEKAKGNPEHSECVGVYLAKWESHYAHIVLALIVGEHHGNAIAEGRYSARE